MATTKAKSPLNGASETIESVVTASSDALKQGLDKAVKSYDNVASFNKATLEALMQSASVTTKGIEALNAETLAFSKQSLEDAVAATKAALTSRSIQELVEVNSDFAKSAFDSYIGQFTKMGDMIVTLAKSAAEPLNGRTAALVDVIQSARVA